MRRFQKWNAQLVLPRPVGPISRMDLAFESPVEGGTSTRVDKAKNVDCAWDCQQSKILIFDDSTSAHDAKSERLVRSP